MHLAGRTYSTRRAIACAETFADFASNCHLGATKQHVRNSFASGVQPLHIIRELFNELEAAHHVTTQVDSETAYSIDNCPITDDVADRLNFFDELTGD